MVVPSGLADSLNAPSLMGIMGATGMVPHQGATTLSAADDGEPADLMREPAPSLSAAASAKH
jgi:hypothetical protein